MLGETHHIKLSRIFPIRWAPSTLKSLTNLRKNRIFLVDHLEEISDDRSFSSVARGKAKYLQGILLDANFMALLIFKIDVLSAVTTESLNYQRKGSTYIQENARQKKFMEKMKKIQQRKGDNWLKFLKNEVQCTNDERDQELYFQSNGTFFYLIVKQLKTMRAASTESIKKNY